MALESPGAVALDSDAGTAATDATVSARVPAAVSANADPEAGANAKANVQVTVTVASAEDGTPHIDDDLGFDPSSIITQVPEPPRSSVHHHPHKLRTKRSTATATTGKSSSNSSSLDTTNISNGGSSNINLNTANSAAGVETSVSAVGSGSSINKVAPVPAEVVSTTTDQRVRSSKYDEFVAQLKGLFLCCFPIPPPSVAVGTIAKDSAPEVFADGQTGPMLTNEDSRDGKTSKAESAKEDWESKAESIKEPDEGALVVPDEVDGSSSHDKKAPTPAPFGSVPPSEAGDSDMHYILPPIKPEFIGRKLLVLDLDETLVHSSFKPVPDADYVIPILIEENYHNVYVLKRPHVDDFIKNMAEHFELAVFTASVSNYADPVLDLLDPQRVIQHRLYREHCVQLNGNYVKDLSVLGRPIEECIIIDNNPMAYAFQPSNAIPCATWYNDMEDDELVELQPFLIGLKEIPDVRKVLGVEAEDAYDSPPI
ncbi:hypothetical protein HDU83_000687 [Entophlyctis luteolus]|nr:hypothetical protein HDU83_000687 [Entophlyctis luteolus]